MNIKMKGILLTILMSVMLTFAGTTVEAVDIMEPSIEISGPNEKTIKEGGTVQYYLSAADDTGIVSFNVTASYIELHNFSANISISGASLGMKTITLSNIRSTNDAAAKYISIKPGTAKDLSGKYDVDTLYSGTFNIEKEAVKDIMEPSVEIKGPSSKNIVSGGTVSYTVTAVDDIGVSKFYLNSSYIDMIGFTANISVSGSTLTLSNIKSTSSSATKYIVIKKGAAVDAAGNKSEAVTSGAFTLTEAKDVMKPSVEVGGPTPKTVVAGGNVTYKITAVDNVKVDKFFINNNYVEMVGFTATIKVSGSDVIFSNVKSTNSSKEKYIIVKAGAAVDTSGNESDSVASGSFTITEPKDIMEPSVEIGGPTPKTVVTGGNVTYKITAVDDTGVKNLYLNSNYIKMVGFTATMKVSGSNVTFSNVKSTNSSKEKYIIVNAGAAVDAAGNKSQAVTSGAFTITEPKDIMEPSVEIGGPTPKTIKVGGSVTYKITAVDDTGVKNLYLNNNYIEMVGFTGTMKVDGNNVTFSNVKSTNSSKEKYIIVKAGAAVDAAGNKSEAVTSGAFTITEDKPVDKDVTKPAVKVDGPTPKTIKVGGSVTYKITAVDDTGVKNLYLNNNYIEMVGFTGTMKVDGNNVTFSNVKSTNSSKEKYIIVKAGAAVDAAGNKSDSVTSGTFTITEDKPVDVDSIAPIVSIGSASPSGVYRGGKVTYVVTFSDNKAVTEVNFSEKDVKLNGFTANIAISGSGLKTRTITLTNIKGNVGSGYSITIAKGVIKDAAGNVNVAVTSPRFSILKSATVVTPSEVVNTTIKGNCIDDLSLLGDINEEITYFSSWLRAEKYTASYVQENNYVAKDERMTYMVEYYNGSTAPAPDVIFTLTIPYKVDVEEINGNGYIKSRTDKETVIEWNMGKISSKAYCRLYVRVKFNEDTDLVNSKDISKVFYATLKTTAGGNTSYSYMRQLYIDKTVGKTGMYKSYLAAIDKTNSIRPEDKITRAEFAKILADCGIVDVDANSTAYKQYKDWESIPVYARAAVAALSETDIIQAFPDGSFKPNNPILMEDAIQMIAQAATYISDTKLTVVKPTFLYKNALKDSYGDITDKKDYIMELMRQNVIVKYESTPDEYALRKDVVSMVNALTFRGPYVEKLPENAIKFADIRDDSVYFYNFVGAANNYSYTYDYRLWQEIVEIQ